MMHALAMMRRFDVCLRKADSFFYRFETCKKRSTAERTCTITRNEKYHKRYHNYNDLWYQYVMSYEANGTPLYDALWLWYVISQIMICNYVLLHKTKQHIKLVT